MYGNSERKIRKIKSLAFFKTGKESNLSSGTCFFCYECCTNYIQKHTARLLGEEAAFSSTFKIELVWCLPALPTASNPPAPWRAANCSHPYPWPKEGGITIGIHMGCPANVTTALAQSLNQLQLPEVLFQKSRLSTFPLAVHINCCLQLFKVCPSVLKCQSAQSRELWANPTFAVPRTAKM